MNNVGNKFPTYVFENNENNNNKKISLLKIFKICFRFLKYFFFFKKKKKTKRQLEFTRIKCDQN